LSDALSKIIAMRNARVSAGNSPTEQKMPLQCDKYANACPPPVPPNPPGHHLWGGTDYPAIEIDKLSLQITGDWWPIDAAGTPLKQAHVCCGKDSILLALKIDLKDMGPLASLLCGKWCIRVCIDCPCGPPQDKPWTCTYWEPFHLCDGDSVDYVCLKLPPIPCTDDDECGTHCDLRVDVAAYSDCPKPQPAGIYASLRGHLHVVKCP